MKALCLAASLCLFQLTLSLGNPGTSGGTFPIRLPENGKRSVCPRFSPFLPVSLSGSRLARGGLSVFDAQQAGGRLNFPGVPSKVA